MSDGRAIDQLGYGSSRPRYVLANPSQNWRQSSLSEPRGLVMFILYDATVRRVPPDLTGAIWGSKIGHCASVKSLG